jgi:hypothetical protein
MKGRVVYLYAFDVANEIRTSEVREVLSQKPFPFQIRMGSQVPRDVRFYQPLTIAMKSETHDGLTVAPFVKIFDIGVISISFERPFDVPDCGALADCHASASLAARAVALAEEVARNLRPTMVKPREEKSPVEVYTVFCVSGVPRAAAEWAAANRRAVAALLNEERDPEKLSTSQVDETWMRSLSYSQGDLVVVDWDAALVVDDEDYFDDVVYVIELANLQLEEFRLLDDRLDGFFAEAYGDLERYSGFFGPRARLRSLRTMRIDTTRMSEETSNITKFVGDWHLAQVYLACKDRFHLGHWETSVDQKLQELDRLYSLVNAEVVERRSLVLEIMIVALFIIDLLALFLLKK